MSSTRSSSSTLTGSVTSIVGKTTVSSSGTSNSEVIACSASLSVVTNLWYVRLARNLSLVDSTWGHSQRSIEPNHLAVQHGVLDDVASQGGVLIGAAEARRERNAGTERLARLLGQAGHHRRVEQARGDRAHADPGLGEVTRGGQRHADDAALGRAVGELTDLAVERGDRGGVDADAALAVGVRLVGEHLGRRKPQHVERADQVDPDEGLERLERMRAAAPGGLFRPRDPPAASPGADGAR